MNLAITIEYDGTNYCGWQIQDGLSTIQGEITNVLEEMLNCKITLHGSGRTDAGVHALNQVANFEYSGNFPIEKIPMAANTHLPTDIRIKKIQIVGDDFNAQYNAKKKTYRYNFYINRTSEPLKDRFSVQVPYRLEKFNVDKFNLALNDLIGEHDFKAFSATGSGISNTIRTIYNARLIQNSNSDFTLEITGNGFLYNMVRIIVGTLVKIALGQKEVNTIKNMINSKDRSLGGVTYPAKGLILASVDYDAIK